MQVVKASRLYFNSQPHKEADFFRFQFLSQHSISTHSLTRRLTAIIVQHPAFPKNFNSQPHKEADGNDNRRSNGNCNFNSQPHKEADILSVTMSDAVAISTHSLTRRLTWTVKNSLPSLQNFNSQPHKEADGGRSIRNRDVRYFNSQPHKEADERQGVLWLQLLISTHSLTRRLTSGSIDVHVHLVFQLTASQGG